MLVGACIAVFMTALWAALGDAWGCAQMLMSGAMSDFYSTKRG